MLGVSVECGVGVGDAEISIHTHRQTSSDTCDMFLAGDREYVEAE